MKTKKELNSLKNEVYVKYFNEQIRDEWWNKKKPYAAKENLLASIPVLIKTQEYLIKKKLKTTYVKKLAGNYNYINCHLKTCLKAKTNDHIVGVKRIGNIVWDSIEEKSLTLKNHKEWIYDNLFLWGKVQMTGDQHKKVEVNPDHLKDNLRFKHYPRNLQKEIMKQLAQINKN
jgi:hypothetical protein